MTGEPRSDATGRVAAEDTGDGVTDTADAGDAGAAGAEGGSAAADGTDDGYEAPIGTLFLLMVYVMVLAGMWVTMYWLMVGR